MKKLFPRFFAYLYLLRVMRGHPGEVAWMIESARLGVQLSEGIGPGKNEEKRKLAQRIAFQSIRVTQTMYGVKLDEVKIYSQLGVLIDTLVACEKKAFQKIEATDEV